MVSPPLDKLKGKEYKTRKPIKTKMQFKKLESKDGIPLLWN